jgi:hypothetical protein
MNDRIIEHKLGKDVRGGLRHLFGNFPGGTEKYH